MFFKDTEGKSWRTFLQPGMGNFVRWQPVFDALNHNREIWLENLVVKGKGLIDADSKFNIRGN